MRTGSFQTFLSWQRKSDRKKSVTPGLLSRTSALRRSPDTTRSPLNPHLDYGYAVTSHSSQGQTADRVLIHVDTELGAKDLLNNRMAYVAVSRGAYDAQLFTHAREKLGAALGHDVSQQSVHAPEAKPEPKQDQTIAPQREIGPQQGQGLGIGM